MRKIDFCGQLILLGLIAFCMLSASIYSDNLIFGMLGMIPLGIWQLISAAIHTCCLQKENKQQLLRTYWIASGTTLIFLCACFVIDGSNSLFSIIFISCMAAGLATAVYYLHVYYKYLLDYV